MNIQAKAKPIRFRIVSGGVECSSLYDLKENFKLDDVVNAIKDGRLVKWLISINENEFADKIKPFKDSDFSQESNQLKMISVFSGKDYVPKYYNANPKPEDIKYLDDKYAKDFARKLLVNYWMDDVELLLYAYHHHQGLIPDIQTCFGNFLETQIPEVLWIYGKSVLEDWCRSNNIADIQEGIHYIKKSADLGCQEAGEYLENKAIIKIAQDYDAAFLKELKQQKIICDPDEFLTDCSKSRIKTYLELNKSGLPGRKHDILELWGFCCVLAKESSMENIRKQFTNTKVPQRKFGSLYPAYEFLQCYALEGDSIESDKERYEKLNYAPARQRANDVLNKTLKTCNGESIKMLHKPYLANYVKFLYAFIKNLPYLDYSSDEQ